MASTPEGRVKTHIKKYLATVSHCWWFMPIGGAYTSGGIPDIVGCVRGQFFAIEVKAPGKLGTVTALQALKMREIDEVGGIVFAADDVEQVRDVFKRAGWDA